jgi:hypothetical protein
MVDISFTISVEPKGMKYVSDTISGIHIIMKTIKGKKIIHFFVSLNLGVSNRSGSSYQHNLTSFLKNKH